MTVSGRRLAVAWQAVLLLAWTTAPAWAEIKEITGSATTTIVQYNGILEIQKDFNREAVPLTTPAPPAVARARLDRLLENGEVTAAGQAVALFDAPVFGGTGPPNDAGLDLGAFSDDSFTSWFVEGTVSEKRTIVLSAADVWEEQPQGQLPTEPPPGESARVESRVILSGVMLITAMDPHRDLSGVEVRLTFSVTHRPEEEEPFPVLEGGVVLVGGQDGRVEVREATGALAGVPLPVIGLPELGAELPLVGAIMFTGIELPYTYDVVFGEPFDLTLAVQSQVLTIPGGTGAAAVFGLPQEGLASVFDRVKKDDRGQRLAEAISQHVDTTGQTYQEQGGVSPAPFPFVFPLCGGMGFEVVGLAIMGCCLTLGRAGRRRPTRCSRGK
ncbi:MAG: hypothetical protein JXQ75_19555 [Phycisphaerae bacterium]|nr:hypothetical protein [Phycisphaerae bacterium]